MRPDAPHPAVAGFPPVAAGGSTGAGPSALDAGGRVARTLMANATFEADPDAAVPSVYERRLPDRGRPALGASAAEDVADATRLLRLLGFVPQDHVIWIDVVHPHAWPVAVPRADVEDDLRAGRLRPRPATIWGVARPLVTEADLAACPPTAAEARRLKKTLAIRDRRWAAIQPLVEDPGQSMFDPDGLGGVDRRITERARAVGASKANVRLWLRRYYQLGQTLSALLPAFARCGAPGVQRLAADGAAAPKRGRPTRLATAGEVGPLAEGINVDPGTRDLLRAGVRFLKQGMRPEEAYRATLKRYFYDVVVRGGVKLYHPGDGVAYPSYGQFLYHTRDLRTPEAVARARLGRAYERKARPRPGTAAGTAFGPGSEYQIDGTTADVYIVSRRDRSQVIGRPTVYVIVDKFSRMIAGLSVTLGHASWRELAAALLVAFTDKTAYCARFGVMLGPDDWPCVGVPEYLLGDRGEPVRQQGNHAVSALRFGLDTTPPYRADWKGLSENKIKFLGLDAARWEPGWVEKGARERGDADYRRSARYTLDEFTAVMLERVLWHNNHRLLRGIALPDGFPISAGVPTPRELWAWGQEHRTGALKSFDPEFIRANLLPAEECAVYAHGIRWSEDLWYVSPSVAASGLMVRRRRGKLPRVTLAVETGRVGRAYVRQRDGTYEEAYLVGASEAYADWTLDEVEDYRARMNASLAMRAPQERAALAAREASGDLRRAVADQETQAAVRAAGRRHVNVDGMQFHRRAERQERDGENAGLEPPPLSSDPALLPPPKPARDPAAATPTSHPVTRAITQPDHRNLLEASLDD